MSDSSPPTAPTSDELTNTFGVLLIGFIFSVVLYGLTFFQTYLYFTRFPSDRPGTKATVGVLWALDTASTTMISHTIYRFLITDFTVGFGELTTTSTFVANQGLIVGGILVVQSYYAFRVWTVANKQPATAAVILALALGAVALGFAGVAHITKQSLFASIVDNRFKLFHGLSAALSTLTDIAIVAAMFYYMQPMRNPGMAIPNGWYEKIVVYGFSRGTSFALVQLIALIVFIATPKQQAWILLEWVSAKIYINSIFAMFNFRNTHRGRGVNEEDSLNQHASNRSNSISAPTGPRETARSVQFTVHPDAKSHDPMNIIELDMVPSRMEGFDDDSTKRRRPASLESGGPSKIHDFDIDVDDK